MALSTAYPSAISTMAAPGLLFMNFTCQRRLALHSAPCTKGEGEGRGKGRGRGGCLPQLTFSTFP